MLLKLLGGIVISAGTWILGKNVEMNYNEKVKIIESYILLLNKFKSAVVFSGINMYSFFIKNKNVYTEKFLDFLLLKKNILYINEFNGANEIEKNCINIISDSFLLAEISSDTELISNSFDEGIYKLTQYKKEYLEEHRGKMKTASTLGLIAGIFIAVLII